jgi:hypothetical protein
VLTLVLLIACAQGYDVDVDMVKLDLHSMHQRCALIIPSYSLHEPFRSRCQACSAWTVREQNANSTLATTWLLEASSRVRSTNEQAHITRLRNRLSLDESTVDRPTIIDSVRPCPLNPRAQISNDMSHRSVVGRWFDKVCPGFFVIVRVPHHRCNGVRYMRPRPVRLPTSRKGPS